MPIYEYRCEKCGEFEHTQRITDAPLQRCPTCKRKVRRLISNTSFQLKGSGWYITDYARAGKTGEKQDAGGGSAAAATASESGKSDAAPSSEPKADTAKADTAKAKPAKKPDGGKPTRASA